MSNSLIAFLLAVGAATYIYNKLMRTSGGNTKSAATVAVMSAALLFVFILVLLKLIPGN